MVHLEKVLIVDLVNHGNGHGLVNKSLIREIGRFFRITYLGRKSTCDFLRVLNFDITYKYLYEYNLKVTRLFYLNSLLLKVLVSSRYSKVFFLAMNVREIRTLVFLYNIIKPKAEIHLFLHSNLEYLVNSDREILTKLFKSNIRKYVFGYWIFNKINSLFLANYLYNIPHPIERKILNSTDPMSMNFVFSGVCTRNKGFNIFCRLWNMFLNHTNAKFSVAGSISKNYCKELQEEFIFLRDIDITDRFLSDENYSSICSKATYFVLPHLENYSLISSGSFMECFMYIKPIITLKNDMSIYYFNKFGNIGYLCENEDELSKVVDFCIHNFDKNIYELQVRNLKNAQLILLKEFDYSIKQNIYL
jgi:glycosyltransferase involved in cell wall biosynthesis